MFVAASNPFARLACLGAIGLSLTRVSAQEASEPDEAAPPASGVENDASPERHRRHALRSNAREAPRPLLYATDDDGNPLAGPMRTLKDTLKDVGISFDLDIAFLGQAASDVETGDDAMTSFFWELTGDWELLPADGPDDGSLVWDVFGGVGLGYEIDSESLSANIGSISAVNVSESRDQPAIVNELFWKQGLADGKVLVLGGKIDMSNHFDTNAVANNLFRQFNSLALYNNLSIPFSSYGGWGGIARAELSENFYATLGIGDSSVSSAVAPWNTSDDSSWYQLLELGLTLDVPGLGAGTYRFIPWHNKLADEDGWGFGVSFDQALGAGGLIGFFRFGVADGDVAPVETFVSGGLALDGPFGRAHDTAAIGVSWSDPNSDAGERSETLIEAYYQFGLSPSVFLAPSVQVILDPASAIDNDSTVVGALRLTMRF